MKPPVLERCTFEDASGCANVLTEESGEQAVTSGLCERDGGGGCGIR